MYNTAVQIGKNLIDVKDMNRALVLRTIWEKGIVFRAKIARQAGLKQTTITNIVATLIACGIVHEASRIKGARGRRPIGLSLNTDRYFIISIRLPHHFILASVYDSGSSRR